MSGAPTSPSLPPLREVIARHDLGAKKTLGQHFLLDLNLTRKIARVAGVEPGDRALEIGPGPGGLTRALLEAGAETVAVERDARCLAALAELEAAYPGRLRVIEGDGLAVDERALLRPGPAKIVANLPYNISTELLVKWLRANHESAPLWSVMTLMFQKEVADRILAAPGSKTYGRLSVIAQAASRPARAFDLPARAFTPPPKVDSSVLVFSPTPARLDFLTTLERVTHAAFAQRRKMLRSSLKALLGEALEAALEDAGVEPTARAENVTVEQFIKLAEICERMRQILRVRSPAQ
ncbi:16S rRNA (adenine(1518)-N(6)/adenine(1519)-N(6))-dimethyltransferase RsmA [Amphiplicatus metriothermophilus]|uniref:Ribosomal RNA small subunit methyltransferase A n=1 Tax=Amphiplicatus metriothermophilus TaxID=1519374 RepID=A0A239PYR9_9PROT|nr:16S rRNA (adenine(1518)-N(6)/adenine(1519)-N(6))-dimethyltransferase RsmA [Amphiplicatus metriothermophilus]MBB5519795.1 16S rRNA (adenine1518-N6/adenine1519-N6)-dimethyltransferase [Amphiplicatus metriothermophilus]SNT75173.1 dimethyladenosine transferase [Amphiplicatus metriothermophilus]